MIAASNYLDKKELCREIAAYQQSGVLSRTLVSMLILVVDGFLSRYGQLNADDVKQELLIQALAAAGKADPSKNCFSYLTTCIANKQKQLARDHTKDRERVIAMIERERAKTEGFRRRGGVKRSD